jgi:hypothetical protein
MSRRPRRRLLGVVTLLFLLTGACSQSDAPPGAKKVFPVRGKVLVQGQPAVGAFVLFVPVNEAAGAAEARPRAYVEADGTFHIETYGSRDGAPPGEYRVSITWLQMVDGREEGPDRLRGRFADAAKSGLKATVKDGPTELDTYDLLPR